MLSAFPTRFIRRLTGLVLGALLVVGCANRNNPNSTLPSRYPQLEAKKVPPFLEGTVMQYTDLGGTEPYYVSGFGLVANLRGTGESTAPIAVREYMIREMVKRGYGTRRIPGFENVQPEAILRSPNFAIVRVDGLIPPGARAGDFFDAYVSALSTSRTSSLAGGTLFRTDLRIDGANEINPGGAVNVFARAQGAVFVNPAYVLNSQNAPAASLRQGVVMDGGNNMLDRPLVLRLRAPERRMSRALEHRIDERFQQAKTAAAQDEGTVHVFVPPQYRGDWAHFAQVVNHLYLDDSPEFVAAKAQELVALALRPDAPLLNISYCWEALGGAALPYIRPLLWHASPDVAYAAARAAALLGDHSAREAMAGIALKNDHPHQLSAIQTLGRLPASHAINDSLRRLLDTDQTLVRIEAYRILAQNRDARILSRVIKAGANEKFVLDVVNSSGPPIVYASRSGIPRIAVIGQRASLAVPFIFSAFDNTLTISAAQNEPNVTIFYRGPGVDRPLKLLSRPDLVEVIARLGGEALRGEDRLDFSYGEIVAMLQAMSDEKKLSGERRGQPMPVAFVLQELGDAEEAIRTAPAIPEQRRPQGDDPPRIGMNLD